MPEYQYRQRPATNDFDKGHEKLYGKRCIKHPQEPKDNCQRCKRNKPISKALAFPRVVV